MKFAEPLWLTAGALLLALLVRAYRAFDRRQRAALADFASSHLLAQLTASFSPGRRKAKRVLFGASIVLVCVALARPQWGYHWEEQKRQGIDILFAIDTSKSMLTQDVAPDRLTRAKLAITDLVHKLDGDRVGLIAFAGDAFLQAPLTIDYDAFQEALDAIDTSTIPRGGTDISSAITEAEAAFNAGEKNRKILVLLTDGEDLEAKGITTAQAAARNGLTIYTIGVGSADGGLIPVPNASGGTDFFKDDSGQFVKSHLDEGTLKQIAAATGGMYEPLGQHGEGLITIYHQALAPLPKQDIAARTQRVYNERFQWPLAAGIACLLASVMIGTRRRQTVRAKRTHLAEAAALLALFLGAGVSAQASPQSAHRAYEQGDYSAAEQQYQAAAERDPQAAPLQFNLGASAYKSGDFDAALQGFQNALHSDDVGVQQQSYYDMGNTQYRVGEKSETSQPQQTIQAWKSAVQSYDAALKLNPADADAKFNRDFVQKKLDQLQQQQKQNDQDNQQQKDQPKQDQKQDQQNGGSQNQQNDSSKSDSQNGKNQESQNQSGQQPNSGPQNQPQSSPGDQNKPQQNASSPNGAQPQTASNGSPPKDPQSQNSGANGQDQKQPTAQNDASPAGPRGETVPDKNSSAQASTAAADKADPAQPGQMTREEARELLDSLKNGEHALPVTADTRNNTAPTQEPPLKDW